MNCQLLRYFTLSQLHFPKQNEEIDAVGSLPNMFVLLEKQLEEMILFWCFDRKPHIVLLVKDLDVWHQCALCEMEIARLKRNQNIENFRENKAGYHELIGRLERRVVVRMVWKFVFVEQKNGR